MTWKETLEILLPPLLKLTKETQHQSLFFLSPSPQASSQEIDP